MPPAQSTLVEEGHEFWRRYPDDLQKGFRGTAVLSELHRRMLKQRYFPVLGSIPKKFVGRNRRGLDINVAQFENDADKTVDRSKWGLPFPNREAAYISLAKYAKDVPAFSAKSVVAMNGAVDWLHRHFGVHMHNSRVKPVEEVIPGLDMTTSPGFPWTRKYATKRIMYDDWKEFTQYMKDDWDRLTDNDYVAIFGNSLKEEVRLQEKIDANSLRTFTAGPIEMTIHGNRLFEDMNEKFYASHLKTASVVGFSPYKGGWDELYRKLKKFDNGFALDESQFDSSLRAYMMWAIAEFRWQMLREEDRTPENKARLQVYYRNLINTVIITSDGVFVQKQGGNPSGSVNTIVDNTLILFILLAYGWQMMCPDVMRSFEAFEDNLALALCGDDNTWTVSDEACQFYNARSLIAEWLKIGIITTTDSLEPRPVEELDFLSAHTVFVDGVAVPLYDREKLLTSLLYSRSPGDPVMTLIRSAALLRVGWVDIQLRGYLRELISWLIETFGDVLRDNKEWKLALGQVVSENELRTFFIGSEGVEFPMISQGKARITPEKAAAIPDRNNVPGIKICETVSMNGLPQRSRGKRQRKVRGAAGRNGKKARVPRLRGAGPLLQGQQRRTRRRQRRGGVPISMGAPFPSMGGSQNARGMPDGIRRQRRTPFAEDEFIADFIGSTTFGSAAVTTATQYAVNPGQAATFPWLAQLAARFEKYVFTKLDFYYKHEVTQFIAAGTIGKAIMSFDYDAADAAPTSKQQMMDTDPHADGMPCEDILFRVDCREAFNNGPKYVRPGNLPGGADIKTYDAGLLSIAGAGNSDGTTKIGEIHVRYAGWFEKPVLESTTSAPSNNQVAWFQSTTTEALATGVAYQELMPVATANGLNAVNTAGSIVLPAGNYLVDYRNAYGFSVDYQSLNVRMQKNGTDIFTSTAAIGTSGAGDLSAVVSAGGYVSLNGTDTLTLSTTAVFAAGTGVVGGSLRIVAV